MAYLKRKTRVAEIIVEDRQVDRGIRRQLR